MGKTTYERGETLVYPNHYPTLTFTPIFGHRGDFMWVDEVKAAWPEHDSEFTFVRSTVHDERVDALKAENDALKESLAEAEHSESRALDRVSKVEDENAKLMELATYALRHIIEAECEKLDRKTFRGKPCEYCVNNGSSDCPKCMPRMFDVSGIEVDE